MTRQELFRGCEAIVLKLPEYDSSDELMIEGVRAAVSVKEWIDASPEAREDLKRELYRALKDAFGVHDIDDHLTREDLKLLDDCIEKLENFETLEDVALIVNDLKKVREL